jgi:hypothetical protein
MAQFTPILVDAFCIADGFAAVRQKHGGKRNSIT